MTRRDACGTSLQAGVEIEVSIDYQGNGSELTIFDVEHERIRERR
jgi:hypothetical protein